MRSRTKTTGAVARPSATLVPPKRPPAIPVERLEAMRVALCRHLADVEPLTFDMGMEIEHALVLMKRHSEKQIQRGRAMRKGTRHQLQCAALAKFLIEFCSYSAEDAVVAAFPNDRGADVDSLVRTYRNLRPNILDPYREWNPIVRSADVIEAQARYKRLNGGKLPARRKVKL
jgi:hypothetical protein